MPFLFLSFSLLESKLFKTFKCQRTDSEEQIYYLHTYICIGCMYTGDIEYSIIHVFQIVLCISI